MLIRVLMRAQARCRAYACFDAATSSHHHYALSFVFIIILETRRHVYESMNTRRRYGAYYVAAIRVSRYYYLCFNARCLCHICFIVDYAPLRATASRAVLAARAVMQREMMYMRCCALYASVSARRY